LLSLSIGITVILFLFCPLYLRLLNATVAITAIAAVNASTTDIDVTGLVDDTPIAA
jgi:hypothetical protein